jgi:hypothetical protein
VTKIVYNGCYGGFSLSLAAWERYIELGGKAESSFDLDRNRTDPILVQVVEELGDRANGMCAELYIDDLTVGTKYRIREYDGLEYIETEEDVKWSIA